MSDDKTRNQGSTGCPERKIDTGNLDGANKAAEKNRKEESKCAERIKLRQLAGDRLDGNSIGRLKGFTFLFDIDPQKLRDNLHK